MNAKQQKVVQRFTQVQNFLDANNALIDPASVAPQRQVLAGVIAQIGTYAQQQQSKGVETVQAHTVASLRDSLRDSQMRPIATIALAKLPITPNLRSAFALPPAKTNALTLITMGQTMAQAAEPYAQVFVQNGLKSTFVDDLTAAITALHNAVTAADNSKVTSKGATSGIEEQLAAGKQAVKLLDSIVRPALSNSKTLLAQWSTVRREAGGPSLGAPAPLPNVIQPITTSAAASSPATSSSPATAPSATSTTSAVSSQSGTASASPLPAAA